jgi:hypothetical protein
LSANPNTADDFHSELIQGQYFIGQTGIGYESRHSPNYA